MLRYFFKKWDYWTKGKERLAQEEGNCRFRFIRWRINNWERHFREGTEISKQPTEIIHMLMNKKSARSRYRAIFYLHENQDIKFDKKNEKYTKEIPKILMTMMKKEKIWWIRIWIILTIKFYQKKIKEFIPKMIKQYNDEKNKWVKIKIIKLMRETRDKRIEEKLLKSLYEENDCTIKEEIILTLQIINPELIGINDIQFSLEQINNTRDLVKRGIFFASAIEGNTNLVEGLKKLLVDKDQKLIIKAMIAWILANIIYKEKLSDNSSSIIMEKIKEAEKDKRNKQEIIWFALALLRIDKSNAYANEIWERMKEYQARRIEHKLLYQNIILNGVDQKTINSRDLRIENDIKTLLKNIKEKSYYDMKIELKLENTKEKAELIKDIIALVNSSVNNNNIAYMIIGLGEKEQEIKAIKNVENFSYIDKKLGEAIEYINIKPKFNFTEIDVQKLYQWKKTGEITKEIPFTEDQKRYTCKDKILIIQLPREAKKVYEISKNIDTHKIGQSWLRRGSHTYDLTQTDRDSLMKK